jgi:hypothetical protein
MHRPKGRGMPGPVVNKAAQEKMAAETKKRREAATPVTNFVMDGDSGLILLSSGRTAGGVSLLEERTVSMTFEEFSQAAAAYVQMVTAAYVGVASMVPQMPAGDGANGPN